MKQEPKFSTVMLIDDNEIDNLINQKMIESLNFCSNILIHSGAKSALEYLKNIDRIKHGAENYLPELIFLDIDMPIMDGFQFLEEFEKMSDTVKNVSKIVLLTSSLDPKDISKSKSNKFIHKFINKPLSQEALSKFLGA
ncbi:MAG: response regulator [Cytophagales bacterium]|nr:response regulator [Cytophagales bacterium]